MTYWISVGCAGGELQERVRSRILAEVVEQCQDRGWLLSAAHVRSGGVQVVLTASVSRDAVRRVLVGALRRHWQHWSTSAARSLERGDAEPAVRATVGPPEHLMAVFVAGA